MNTVEMNAMDDPDLFAEGDIRVTPTWLTLGATSHAMHTLTKVHLAERAVPRGSWTILFYVSLALIVLSAFALQRAHMPYVLGMVLFVSSIALCLAASWFAFVARDSYRLDITLSDGSSVPVVRPGRAFMVRLEKAIRDALVMHRGLFREPMVDMQTRNKQRSAEHVESTGGAADRLTARPPGAAERRSAQRKPDTSARPASDDVRRIVVASAAARGAANGE